MAVYLSKMAATMGGPTSIPVDLSNVWCTCLSEIVNF